MADALFFHFPVNPFLLSSIELSCQKFRNFNNRKFVNFPLFHFQTVKQYYTGTAAKKGAGHNRQTPLSTGLPESEDREQRVLLLLVAAGERIERGTESRQ
ncbi:MAG TPA: hypothetical protein K8W19_14895, partial [Victivallis vadensis]|nr:hypothetical protein [Victivallis vadensis]